MSITAAEVNKLRKHTGAGMMDCKKALTEAGGDFDKAIEILRKKGQKNCGQARRKHHWRGCCSRFHQCGWKPRMHHFLEL